MSLTLGPLHRDHRARVRAILDATAAFHSDEIDVALELFDESMPAEPPLLSLDGETHPVDYEFVGLFSGDHELLGYACYGATPGTDRAYDLYWIAVHPAAQRTGAGSRLLDEVERRLGQQDSRLLIVETSSRQDYEATRRFYEVHGYVAAARIRDFYAPGDDRVIYSKRLHGSPSGAPSS